jgi:hypothetical protein
MKTKALLCDKCGTAVFSRARHDFRYCECENIAVDGGYEGGIDWGGYNKMSVKTGATYKVVNIEIKASHAEIYKDWNFGTDKFGNHKLSAKNSKVIISEEEKSA